MGETRNIHRISVKKLLGKQRRWEFENKMDHRKTSREDVNWTELIVLCPMVRRVNYMQYDQ
jgi:hypothetical protein